MTMAFMPFGYSDVRRHRRRLRDLPRSSSSLKGQARKVHPLMWLVSCALFIIYFLMGPLQRLLGVG